MSEAFNRLDPRQLRSRILGVRIPPPEFLEAEEVSGVIPCDDDPGAFRCELLNPDGEVCGRVLRDRRAVHTHTS
eukprot:9467734-Pyramimonas_sp.AAC.1